MPMKYGWFGLENSKMNELIVNADGTTTVVGDAGSVSGILTDLVKAIPFLKNVMLMVL